MCVLVNLLSFDSVCDYFLHRCLDLCFVEKRRKMDVIRRCLLKYTFCCIPLQDISYIKWLTVNSTYTLPLGFLASSRYSDIYLLEALYLLYICYICYLSGYLSAIYLLYLLSSWLYICYISGYLSAIYLSGLAWNSSSKFILGSVVSIFCFYKL